MKKLCECGCGQETNIITHTCNAKGLIKGEYRRFVIGHHNKGRYYKNKSKKLSETWKRKYKEGYVSPLLGKSWRIKDTSKMRKPKSKIHKENLSKSHIGKPTWNKYLTKETNESLRQLSESRKGKNNPMYGIHLVGEKNGMFGKHHTEETLKKIWKKLGGRPTSYEKKISELCIERNLPFIYTGNGTFLIGHKNPDFRHKNLPIVIEVYEKYFKIVGYGSCEEYEEQRSEYFAKYGWKVIFIRTEDILSKNWKEICLNKLRSDEVLKEIETEKS